MATPIKLRNGNWGVKVQGTAREGDAVEVRTRAGKTWTATIKKVIWAGNGVSICATAPVRVYSSNGAFPGPRGRRMGPGHGQAAPVRGYSSYCTDTPDCGCYDCAS